MAAEPSLSATALGFTAEPLVDLERVARFRKAIQENNYPIRPALVADRLLAAKMEWGSK